MYPNMWTEFTALLLLYTCDPITFDPCEYQVLTGERTGTIKNDADLIIKS